MGNKNKSGTSPNAPLAWKPWGAKYSVPPLSSRRAGGTGLVSSESQGVLEGVFVRSTASQLGGLLMVSFGRKSRRSDYPWLPPPSPRSCHKWTAMPPRCSVQTRPPRTGRDPRSCTCGACPLLRGCNEKSRPLNPSCNVSHGKTFHCHQWSTQNADHVSQEKGPCHDFSYPCIVPWYSCASRASNSNLQAEPIYTWQQWPSGVLYSDTHIHNYT
jgi:hypothetical protein